MMQRDTLYNDNCYRHDAEIECFDADNNIFISTDENTRYPPQRQQSIAIVQYIYQ